MNSGNLLDSLLAAGKTSPATKKITKQQASNQAADGFQSAMAQVRPKVAARPAQKAPAQSDTTVAHTRKEAARVDSRPSSNRPEATREVKQAKQNDHQSAADKTSLKDAPVQNEPNTPADGQVDAEEGKGGIAAVVGSTEKEGSTEAALEQELLLQPTVTLNVLPPQDQNLPLNEGVLLNGLLVDAPDQHVADLNLMPTTKLASTAESSAEINLEGLSEEELASLLVTASAGGATVSSSIANQLAGSAALTSGANAVVSLNPLQGLAAGQWLPESGVEGELTLSPEVAAGDELLTSGEVGDNPDLLLLNAKAVMARLADASAGSLDKQASTAELPKALSAAAPAIESLSRLAEAQSPTARGFVVQTGVPVPMGQPQWGQGVSERVLWLAAQNVSAAEIRLDPPELGPMQVRVSVNQEQVNISFVSPHPAVRDALDQQLQRLREMFSEQGLNLGNVDVSDKSFSQQDQERDEAARKGTATIDNEELTPTASQLVVSNRLVDHYA
uniref:flagellar hook-length control protein FliK n=1 Tax=Cellvibrio fontiphilus TaxID=1815559 RepID=UPI002B4C2385|nr:flagellar hook-length control protein FliK [Cellvibrio fontiphilus]